MTYTKENSINPYAEYLIMKRKVENTWRFKHYNETYFDNEDYFEGLLEEMKDTNQIVYAKFKD